MGKALWAEVFAFPIRKGGLGAWLGMAVVLAVFKGAAVLLPLGLKHFDIFWAFMPMAALVAFYAVGLQMAFMMAVVRQTAAGSLDVDAPDFTNLWMDVARPALLFMLGTLFLTVPATSRLVEAGGWDESSGLWPWCAAAVLYVPWLVLTGAAGASLLQAMNPLFVAGVLFRLGRPVLPVLGLSAVLAIPGVLLQLAALWLWSAFPVLGAIPGELVGLFVPLVLARALGLLLKAHGDALGYGVAQDYLEPVLPGAETP